MPDRIQIKPRHVYLTKVLLVGIAESDSAYIATRYRSVVCPSVCPSATLLHPAKAVGRNDMPFGRGTRVVTGNIVLDRASIEWGRFGVWARAVRSARTDLITIVVQERPAVADKLARRLRKVSTVYVRAVGWL